MYKQEDVSCGKTTDNLLLTRRNKLAQYMEAAARKEKVKSFLDELENCVPPGTTELKQVESFLKWRKLVPEEYWDSTYLRPKQEVLD